MPFFKKFQAVLGSRFDGGHESVFVALEPVLQNVEQWLIWLNRRALGNQSFQFADLSDASEPFVFEFATGEGQLFVKAMVVSAGDHQARPDRHCRD